MNQQFQNNYQEYQQFQSQQPLQMNQYQQFNTDNVLFVTDLPEETGEEDFVTQDLDKCVIFADKVGKEGKRLLMIQSKGDFKKKLNNFLILKISPQGVTIKFIGDKKLTEEAKLKKINELKALLVEQFPFLDVPTKYP